MRLTASSTDEEILSVVEDWISDLAQGLYERALRRVAVDVSSRWSPAMLEAVVAGYGLPDPHPSGIVFRVTPAGSAAGGPPRRSIDRAFLPPGALAHVQHDLPLNGEWSDLTATFTLLESDDVATLQLDEVHVL
jgi:hypothetical protein